MFDCYVMDVMCVPPFDNNPCGGQKKEEDALSREKRLLFESLKKEHELFQGFFAREAIRFVHDGEYDDFIPDNLLRFRKKNKVKTLAEREPPPPPPPNPPPTPPLLCSTICHMICWLC